MYVFNYLYDNKYSLIDIPLKYLPIHKFKLNSTTYGRLSSPNALPQDHTNKIITTQELPSYSYPPKPQYVVAYIYRHPNHSLPHSSHPMNSPGPKHHSPSQGPTPPLPLPHHSFSNFPLPTSAPHRASPQCHCSYARGGTCSPQLCYSISPQWPSSSTSSRSTVTMQLRMRLEMQRSQQLHPRLVCRCGDSRLCQRKMRGSSAGLDILLL
jgi:hypothetical protein